MTDEAKRCAQSCREWYVALSYLGRGNESSAKELLATADLIESLSAELEQVKQERDGLSIMLTTAESANETYKRERDEACNDLDALNYAITELHGAYDAMKRERDAAVEDVRLAVCDDLKCSTCMYKGNESHMCDDCDVHTFCNWQWRGVKEGNNGQMEMV